MTYDKGWYVNDELCSAFMAGVYDLQLKINEAGSATLTVYDGRLQPIFRRDGDMQTALREARIFLSERRQEIDYLYRCIEEIEADLYQKGKLYSTS